MCSSRAVPRYSRWVSRYSPGRPRTMAELFMAGIDAAAFGIPVAFRGGVGQTSPARRSGTPPGQPGLPHYLPESAGSVFGPPCAVVYGQHRHRHRREAAPSRNTASQAAALGDAGGCPGAGRGPDSDDWGSRCPIGNACPMRQRVFGRACSPEGSPPHIMSSPQPFILPFRAASGPETL